MLDLYDLMGLVGVALTLFAYARVQWRREYAKQLSYSLLNFASGVFLAVSLWHKWNLASFIGNSTWAVISLYGIVRCLRYMRRGAATTPTAGTSQIAVE